MAVPRQISARASASPTRAVRAAIRSALEAAAEPGRALAMQAYMKSEMPYLGVPMPKLRTVCRTVFAAHPTGFGTAEVWAGTARALWSGASHREEWYAAIEWTGMRGARPYQTLDALPLYEEWIVAGAWWDLVDPIATHRVGPLLRAFPKPMARTLRTWSRDANLWKRRTSIIAQLAFKTDTDLELLFACIEPSLASTEFFLRKAIGWALRQYAWTDATPILQYVRANHDRLSPLSRREALKNLDVAR